MTVHQIQPVVCSQCCLPKFPTRIRKADGVCDECLDFKQDEADTDLSTFEGLNDQVSEVW